MIKRIVCTIVLGLGWIQVAHAQGLPQYREFHLGANLATVANATGARQSDVKVIHQRPALIQEMEWRPRYFPGRVPSQTDPVDLMVFGFYDDQLYKISVDYDVRKTEGLAPADLMHAISAEFGAPPSLLASTLRAPEMQYGDSDRLLATWSGADYSLKLFRVSYQNAFRLIVESATLADRARLARREALRLDAVEAPARDLARQRQEAEAARYADDEAKRANLPGFRP